MDSPIPLVSDLAYHHNIRIVEQKASNNNITSKEITSHKKSRLDISKSWTVSIIASASTPSDQ